MHILFVEDGEMEKRTFLATWKDIPVQNEIQYEIKDVEHNAGLLVFSLKYCLYKQMLCAKSNCEEFNSSFKKTSCKEIGSNQHGLIWKYIFFYRILNITTVFVIGKLFASADNTHANT